MFAEGRGSIRKKLLKIVIFPIVLLSVVITTTGMILFNRLYTQNIHDELVSTTNMMFDCLDLVVDGDYAYQDGMLIKGDLNITNSKMLLRVKAESQIDTTIFWKDTRIMTTVQDENGVSAVGTKAGQEVVDAVLRDGRSYFSENLGIGGLKYIGYYVPIENSDKEIVGMMFAGKQKILVYEKILEIAVCFTLFSVIIIVISVLIAKNFSTRIIADIDLINDYLKKISEGDLRTRLDEKIVKRNDEISSIGLYASAMREELQKLVERDPLTNLYNRRSCHNLLEMLEEKNETYCAIMCDIDLFKKVNDNFGHDVGDYVLVEISRLLQENVEGTGFASRWGGEEFLLIYRLDFEKTVEKARKLQQSIRDFAFCYQDIGMNVTMTFGIAEGTKGVPYEDVIKEADEKLYVGKKNGRDQIVA